MNEILKAAESLLNSDYSRGSLAFKCLELDLAWAIKKHRLQKPDPKLDQFVDFIRYLRKDGEISDNDLEILKCFIDALGWSEETEAFVQNACSKIENILDADKQCFLDLDDDKFELLVKQHQDLKLPAS